MRILYFDIDGVLLSYEDEQRSILCGGVLDRIFVDKEWFLSVLELGYDSDNRCSHIDLTGNRILQVDPHGNGSDILEWLGELE